MISDEEKAIKFIAEFYNVSRETVADLYWDEVESYIWLLNESNKDLKNDSNL